jgi:imidazolonepropionase-like amidohydrolase
MHIDRRTFLIGAGATAAGAGIAVAAPRARNPAVLVKNVRLFDGVSPKLVNGHLLAEGALITRVSGSPIDPPPGCAVIDGRGQTLMPGLTDAHWHFALAANRPADLDAVDDGLMFADMVTEAKRQLLRGFTTVRDCAGPTFGIKKAIDEGRIPGPRIYPSGAMLSQTSGHGDHAAAYALSPTFAGTPSHFQQLGLEIVVDGVPAVLAGARQQLRRGASQIKIAAGGGIVSDFDPIDSAQFTMAELSAAVEAAQAWGTYVMAHAYSANSIRRCVEAGVACIEHGHLMDEPTMALLGEKGVWLSTQAFTAGDQPVSPEMHAKGAMVNGAYEHLLRWAKKHGVRVAFGTDLVFQPDSPVENRMLTKFATVYSNAETLRIATSGNAALFAMSGARNPYKPAPLGTLKPGAWADFLLVKGNPLETIDVLANYDENLLLICKNGEIHKNIVPA